MKFLLFCLAFSIFFLPCSSRAQEAQNRIDSLKLKLAKAKNDNDKVFLLKEISDEFVDKGKYHEALASLLDALRIRERSGEDSSASITLISDIGNIYNYLSNVPKSQEYYLRALGMMERMPCDTLVWITTLDNMGLTFNRASTPDSAIYYFNKALELARKKKFMRGISLSLGNIGYQYEMKEDYAKAYLNYKESLFYAEKTGDPKSIAFCSNNMGFVTIYLKRFDEALDYLYKGLQTARKAGIMDVVRDSYEGLALAYSSKNDYKNAFEFEKMLHYISDSLYNAESSRQIAEMQTKYETEKKDKELLKKEAENKQKTTERNAFIAGFGLMIVLVFFIFRGYRQKRKANIEISKQKHVIEEKQKEILDSIYYARRIQRSLLPSHRNIEKMMGKLRKKL